LRPGDPGWAPKVVRADRDGADPASVAFEAVSAGISGGVDTVIVDTAGRLPHEDRP